MKYNIPLIGVIFLLICSIAAPVHAHRVIIFAWTEGETVHTVSKFPGGSKAVDTPVAVYDDQGNQLLEGKTDDKGEFSFDIPKQTSLKIVLEAGSGHKAEWTLSEQEVRTSLGNHPAAGDTAPEKMEKQSENTNSPASANNEDSGHTHENPVYAVNAEQIEFIVSKEISRQVQPMMRMLSEMQETGPSVSDIFGGIGYILGLFGIAAYISSRKNIRK